MLRCVEEARGSRQNPKLRFLQSSDCRANYAVTCQPIETQSVEKLKGISCKLIGRGASPISFLCAEALHVCPCIKGAWELVSQSELATTREILRPTMGLDG